MSKNTEGIVLQNTTAPEAIREKEYRNTLARLQDFIGGIRISNIKFSTILALVALSITSTAGHAAPPSYQITKTQNSISRVIPNFYKICNPKCTYRVKGKNKKYANPPSVRPADKVSVDTKSKIVTIEKASTAEQLFLLNIPNEVKSSARSAEEKYGIPEGMMVSLSAKESGFNKNARSGKNAKGYVQLLNPSKTSLRSAGAPRNYVFGSNTNMDFLIGAAYLKELYEKTGNWNNALKAYNGGYKGFREGRYARGYDTTIMSLRNKYIQSDSL